MIPWDERPPEIAHLFNPAFCGVLLARTTDAYVGESGEGMPFTLAFMPLPIVLHEPTREVLPKAKTTSLLVWLQRHPEVRVGFRDRMRSLVPYTREAILFMATHGYLSIDPGGRIVSTKQVRGVTRLQKQSTEYKQCAGRAELIGRMLARAGQAVTVFALWGIRP